MNVCVKDYCKSHKNALSKALKPLIDHSILLKDGMLEIYRYEGEWWCKLIIPYTFSCNDMTAISDAFSGFWWCISGHFDRCTMILSVNFGDVKV